MTVVAPYDVYLNGKPYMLVPKTYVELPIIESIVRPGQTRLGNVQNTEFPEWAFWEQSFFQGDGMIEWMGDDAQGFATGYGLDLRDDGQLGNAEAFSWQFTNMVNGDEGANGNIIVPFPGFILFLNKDTAPGKIWKWDGSSLTGGITLTPAVGFTSWAFFRDAVAIGTNDGRIVTTTNGSGWSNFTGITQPNANRAMVLGTYRNKLYIAWDKDLYTFDGTALTKLSTLDSAPICAASGAGSLFIVAGGIPAHLYMVNNDSLVELAQWPTNFEPGDCIFTDTLYIGGGTPLISPNYTGEIWRITNAGLELHYQIPKVHGNQDYKIRAMWSDQGYIYYGYNKGAGVGVYDSTQDKFEDPVLGFYLANKTFATRTGAGQIAAIGTFKSEIFVSIMGEGIYRTQAGSNIFVDYQVTSVNFGWDSKKVNKLWGWVEITNSPLINSNQSIKVEISSDDGTTWTNLGTYAGPRGESLIVPFPADYRSGQIKWRITVVCNSFEIKIYDVSVSFIVASRNPKKRWHFVLALAGSDVRPMRDHNNQPLDRSGITMKIELDALWNQKFVFKDLFGNSYDVMMPAPGVQVEGVIRDVTDDQVSVENLKAKYTINIVQV